MKRPYSLSAKEDVNAHSMAWGVHRRQIVEIRVRHFQAILRYLLA